MANSVIENLPITTPHTKVSFAGACKKLVFDQSVSDNDIESAIRDYNAKFGNLYSGLALEKTVNRMGVAIRAARAELNRLGITGISLIENKEIPIDGDKKTYARCSAIGFDNQGNRCIIYADIKRSPSTPKNLVGEAALILNLEDELSRMGGNNLVVVKPLATTAKKSSILDLNKLTKENLAIEMEQFKKNAEASRPNDVIKEKIANYSEPATAKEAAAITKIIPVEDYSDTAIQIMQHDKGCAIVEAPAGSGKTTLLTQKIVYQLLHGAKPEDMYIVTFTNAATEELKSRVASYMEYYGATDIDLTKLHIGTFHALGSKMLEEMGYTVNEMDDFQKKGLIEEVVLSAPQIADIPDWKYESYDLPAMFGGGGIVETCSAIFDKIRETITLNGSLPKDSPYEKYMDVYMRYCNAKDKGSFYDFTDRDCAFYVCSGNMDFSGKHLIVDEFQDVNEVELKAIANIYAKYGDKVEITCVGDRDQAIYGFRGGTPEGMTEAKKLFNGCDVYTISESFRCSQAVANAVNECYPSKPFCTTSKEIGSVDASMVAEENLITDVCNAVSSYLLDGEKDLCVLARTKKELVEIEAELDKRGIKSFIYAPEKLFDNPQVQLAMDLYASLKTGSTAGIYEYINAKNYEKGGLEHMTEAEISKEFADVKANLKNYTDWYEMISKISDTKKNPVYAEFLNLVERWKSCVNPEIIKKRMKYLESYGEDATIRNPLKYDGVLLSTYHSFKGCEADTVVMCNRGNRDSLDNNCFYVGVTRAKKNLKFFSSNAHDTYRIMQIEKAKQRTETLKKDKAKAR